MAVGRTGVLSLNRQESLPVSISKPVYLLILMLISVDFFHFAPISAATTNDICLVLFLLWLLAGHFLYRPVREYATVTIKYYYSLLVLIWIGVLISFIPALLLYGQSFVMSAVTSRVMLSTLALPVIGMIKPGMKDFERAVVWFSLILLVLGILDAMGLPILDRSFFQKEDNPFHDHIDSDSFIYLLPGFHWVAIALFFYLQRLRKRINVENVLGSLFFMASVYLLQNRTMLFACALVFLFTVFSIKGADRRQTSIIRVSAVALLVAAVAFTVPQWLKLINETASQLGDKDYNRLLAYNYFLFEACPSAPYYFTGTGLISANASSIMKDLMSAGIYNSDVGIIGMWNFYGILPVAAVAYVVFKGLLGRSSYFVKYNAFFILIGSFTIASFDSMDKLLWLCMFIYFVFELSLRKRAVPRKQ